MKNLTRIGASLLGTWSAEVKLSNHGKDSLSAFLAVHFMADPRKGHGCELDGCSEMQNRVCVLKEDNDGHVKKVCKPIEDERDVSWSDCKWHDASGTQNW